MCTRRAEDLQTFRTPHRWPHSVPRSCFSNMQTNPCHVVQLLSEQIVNVPGSFRSGQHVHVIVKSENHFAFLQMLLDLSESVVHGQAKQKRHKRVAICRCCPLPSLPCCQGTARDELPATTLGSTSRSAIRGRIRQPWPRLHDPRKLFQPKSTSRIDMVHKLSRCPRCFFCSHTAESTRMVSHIDPETNSGGTYSTHQRTGTRLKSPRTSASQGTSPSAPDWPRRSSKDDGRARAAAQARREPHQWAQDCRARVRNGSGIDRVFARANKRMNVCVSSENRPPVSPAKTISLARPWSPESSGKCALFDVALPRTRPRPRQNIVGEARDQRGGVKPEWCRSPAGPQSWKAFGIDLNAPCTQCRNCHHVQITQEDVR